MMFLARLAGLLKKNDPRIVAIELESAFHTFAGLPRNLVLRMDAVSLLHIFSVTGELDGDRAIITALLLKEEAALLRQVGSSDEAAILLERSQRLVDAACAVPISPELREYIAQKHG